MYDTCIDCLSWHMCMLKCQESDTLMFRSVLDPSANSRSICIAIGYIYDLSSDD